MPFYIGYKDMGEMSAEGIPVSHVVVGRQGFATRAEAEAAAPPHEEVVRESYTDRGQSTESLEFFIVEADDAWGAIAHVPGEPMPPEP